MTAGRVSVGLTVDVLLQDRTDFAALPQSRSVAIDVRVLARMTPGRSEQLLRDAVRRIATSCPRLVAQCYWVGTSAIALEDNEKLTAQVFAAFDDVPDEDLVSSSTAPALRRVALQRYLADKIQCVVERIEARDLAGIHAVLRLRPTLPRLLARQDALHIAERLLGWTDESLRADLRAHADIDPGDAIAARDELLALLRSNEKEDPR